MLLLSSPQNVSIGPQLEPGSHTCHICLSPGHVQVAQVPGRGEPDSPGELNFPYLFQLLEDEGYKGFVGCEYRPLGEGVLGLRAWPWGGSSGGTAALLLFSWGECHRLPLSSGDTAEGLNWLRSYWERRGRPQAGQ